MKKTIKIVLIIIFVLAVSVIILALKPPYGISKTGEVSFGLTFSKYFAQKMDLDWQTAYLSILDELKPRSLRLPVYWPAIEKQSNEYSFGDYDWMVEQARQRQVKLILVIGRRLPRWPECHVPDWASGLNDKSQQSRVLKLIPEIVNRYKGYENVFAWQVENEPFLSFGECPGISGKFLDEEIKLVKSLDSRPVIVTDSGELSLWVFAAKRADIFGTTMYRVVWSDKLNRHFEYPLPPQFFWLKANLVRIFYKQKPIFVCELQAEPWDHRMLYETTVEEQMKSMNLDQFRENIAYAKKVGFREAYLWGAEWWYWMKVKQGDESFWEEAKKVISNSQIPNYNSQ